MTVNCQMSSGIVNVNFVEEDLYQVLSNIYDFYLHGTYHRFIILNLNYSNES